MNFPKIPKIPSIPSIPNIPNIPSISSISSVIPVTVPPIVTNLVQDVQTEVVKASNNPYSYLPNILPSVLPNISSSAISDIISNNIPSIITDYIPSSNDIANTLLEKFLKENDLSLIADTLLEQFLKEYDLTKLTAAILLVLLVIFCAVVPGILSTFYSEKYKISLFYSYLLIFVIVGSCIWSYYSLPKEKRNNVLIFNSIITILITLNAIYLAQ